MLLKDITDGWVEGVVTVITGFAWLVKLDGRVEDSETRLKTLEARHQLLEDKIYTELSEIKSSIGRIEGRLSIGQTQQTP